MILRLLLKLIFPPLTLPGFTAKLMFQYLLMFLLVGIDAFMFWYLIHGLVQVEDSQLDPAIAALIGGLITGVTGAIGMGIRDLFNPIDDTPLPPEPPTTPTS